MSKIILPGTPIEKDTWGDKVSRYNTARAKEKATEQQWTLVKEVIESFIQKYPKQWLAFQNDLRLNRSEYNVAHKTEEVGLHEANWRNTAAFPIIKRLDELDEVVSESLLDVIEKIIPGLTKTESKNYKEFLKRFPAFQVPEHL
jgi:hypothetical protein